MKNFDRRPPKGLSTDARRWWRRLLEEHQIEDQAGLLILQQAMQSFDRLSTARAQIKTDGQMVTDRFGQKKAHPLLTVERDARAAMLSALKQLNLDLEPLRDGPGRPPAGSN